MEWKPEHYFTERMEAGEPVEEGVTNSVAVTDYGTVVKEYEDYPLTSLNETAGKILPRIVENIARQTSTADVKQVYRKLVSNEMKQSVLNMPVDDAIHLLSDATHGVSYTSREDRMRMERRWTDILEDTPLYAPDITAYGDQHIEFEHVSGESMKQYAETAETTDVYEAAVTIGDAMQTLHSRGYALDDNLLNNYMIDENRNIWSIDHEYATDDAYESDKFLDMLTLLSDARHLPADRYNAVRNGIEEGYGEDIPLCADIGAGISSPFAAKLWAKNPEWTQNAVENTVSDLKQYL